MTRTYNARGGQTAMFRDARPEASSCANRGKSLEDALSGMHEEYRLRGRGRVDKQYVPALPVGDGCWAKVIGKSTVDYVGIIDGRHVAFDAKSVLGNRMPLSMLKPHQQEYLSEQHRLGGVAFVLARFEMPGTRMTFAVPIVAWELCAEGQGGFACAYGGKFQATGLRSIRTGDLPDAWRVEGYDWAKVVTA